MNTNSPQLSKPPVDKWFGYRLIFSGMCIAGLLLGGYLVVLRSNVVASRRHRHEDIGDIRIILNGLLALAELICWTLAGVGGIGWIMTRQRSVNSLAEQSAKATRRTMTPSDVERLVRSRATSMLEIPEVNFTASIERQLLVSPADLLQFLDDLNIDHGLPVSSADRKRIDSIEDLVRLVSSRVTAASSPPLSV